MADIKVRTLSSEEREQGIKGTYGFIYAGQKYDSQKNNRYGSITGPISFWTNGKLVVIGITKDVQIKVMGSLTPSLKASLEADPFQ
jgi:hypothetical protein